MEYDTDARQMRRKHNYHLDYAGRESSSGLWAENNLDRAWKDLPASPLAFEDKRQMRSISISQSMSKAGSVKN
jgi:hypothetical protein